MTHSGRTGLTGSGKTGYTLDWSNVMPKKKPKRFSAVATVKAMARERIGTPPTSRVVPDRKKKQEEAQKHKPTMGRLLGELE
jgi:hypothetical protein